MFSATARRFARVGIRSAKQFNSSASISNSTHSHLGYVLAVGAAGVASIALLKKHLSAQEPESGYLYTWGSGQFGQLGLGSQNDESLPRLVKEIEDEGCTFVTAGANTTAVITKGGRLWTFGQGDSNQLGQGNTEDSSNQVLPCEVEDAFDGQPIIDCSVCDGHMAAVAADGSVWTWGRSTFGRLGHEVTETGRPEKVPGLEGHRFVQVCAGHVHTLALTEDGEVFAWGNNKTGCVGCEERGTCAPQRVEGLKGKRVVAIAAGMESSAALTAEGEVYTWGADNYGQLGQGQGPRYVNKPAKIRIFKNMPITKIACGQYHMLALASNGDVYAWGQGLQGQTANEKKVDTNIPHAIDALKGYGIKQIAAGGSHSAVVDDKGRVFMFGSGRNGQLGRGDKVESIAAYRVVPTLVEYLQTARVMQIVCGGDHTAAILATKI